MGRAEQGRVALLQRRRLGRPTAAYVKANLKHVLSLRDDGPNKGKPVFMHCYAVPIRRARPAPTTWTPPSGPWLYPALEGLRHPAGRLGGDEPADAVQARRAC